VTVAQDGSVYRIKAASKLDAGANLVGKVQLRNPGDTVDLGDATNPLRIDPTGTTKQPTNIHDGAGNALESLVDDAGDRRLRVQSNFPPGQSILLGNQMPQTLSYIRREYALNGSSNDLRVDGSTTPVEFTFDAHASFDYSLYEVRFIFSCQDIIFDGASFGPVATLPNGMKLEVTYNNGLETALMALIKINEDLLMFPSPANAILNNTGPKDILVMGMFYGGGPVLKGGTSDNVKITIQDDLTSNSINTLKAQIFAVRE